VPLVAVAALAVPIVPAQATCRAAGPEAYVSNSAQGTVSVINNCAQVIATIPVGNHPNGLAVTPDGKKVYVGDNQGVSVIDTATNMVATTIGLPDGQTASGVAVSPDGSTVYAAGLSAANIGIVSIIITATDMVATTIEVGNDPEGVAVSPDGSAVYVANFRDGTVSVISQGLVTATISVGIEPTSVVVSPDGATVYVLRFNGTVIAIDASDNQPFLSFTASTDDTASGFDLAISPDGGALYSENDNLNMVPIDSTSLYGAIGSIPVGRGPRGVAVTADGIFGYVTNFSDNTVSKFNVNAASVVNTINVDIGPTNVATVPAMSSIASIFMQGAFCTAPGSCLAVGTQATATGTGGLALVRTGGRWRRTEPLGLAGTTDDTVYQVACRSITACVAVGGANAIPATGGPSRPVPLAAVWNGATWAASQPPAPPGTAAVLRDVSCLSGGSACLAVGYYRDSAGLEAPLSDQWVGGRWSSLPTPNARGAISGRLTSVSCRGSQCAATGIYRTSESGSVPLAEAWNGIKWRIEPNSSAAGKRGFGAFQYVACATATRCMAVINAKASGRTVPFSEQLVAGRWHQLATAKVPGNAMLDSISCPALNRCIAIGSTASHGKQSPIAEEWNGTRWLLLKLPGPTSATLSRLTHITCPSARACLAVGNDGRKPLAETWNGRSWRILATPS
jgi:YVTN family beta-propeller protein